MYRTHTCGELRLADAGKEVTLCGWVQRVRDKGSLVWIDLRDRYGITQLFLQDGVSSPELMEQARSFGREYVLQVKGWSSSANRRIRTCLRAKSKSASMASIC